MEKGYITLISVLVTGAIAVAISIALILSGVSASRTSLVLEQSGQAKALADACAESALLSVYASPSFTGSGSLSIGQGSCSYTVTNTGGQNNTITATGVVGTVIRKVKILGTATTPITISTWQEVADF